MDHILAQADLLIPDCSPELLGAVGLPQYMPYEQRGWHIEKGPMAECRPEETFPCRGPLGVFQVIMVVDVKCSKV